MCPWLFCLCYVQSAADDANIVCNITNIEIPPKRLLSAPWTFFCIVFRNVCVTIIKAAFISQYQNVLCRIYSMNNCNRDFNSQLFYAIYASALSNYNYTVFFI